MFKGKYFVWEDLIFGSTRSKILINFRWPQTTTSTYNIYYNISSATITVIQNITLPSDTYIYFSFCPFCFELYVFKCQRNNFNSLSGKNNGDFARIAVNGKPRNIWLDGSKS